MNGLYYHWISLSENLFMLLGRQVLYSAGVALFVVVLSHLTRRRPPLWHLGLWYLVLMRLILPPDLASPLSARVLLERIGHSSVIVRVLAGLGYGDPVDAQGLETGNSSILVKTSYLKAGSNPAAAPGLPFAPAVMALWGIIAGFFLLRMVRMHRRLGLLIKSCPPVADKQWLQEMRAVQTMLHIRRSIRLMQGDVPGPFAGGVWRPFIVLPRTTVASADRCTRQAILTHELLHIRRGDALWLILENGLRSLFFFHPFLGHALQRIHLFRECHIDRQVLRVTRLTAHQYGEGLLSTLKWNKTSLPRVGDAFLCSNQHNLALRLKKLQGGTPMNHKEQIGIGLVILIGAILLPMAASHSPAQAAAPEQSQQMAQWIAPISTGRVTSAFGQRKHPITGELAFHRAIDVAAPLGTELYAAADGIVTLAVNDHEPGKGYGRNLILKHDEIWQMRYGQLDTCLVVEGQSVRAGECIARVGSSGLSTGPHVHFELIRNGEFVDPQQWIDFSHLTQKVD